MTDLLLHDWPRNFGEEYNTNFFIVVIDLKRSTLTVRCSDKVTDEFQKKESYKFTYDLGLACFACSFLIMSGSLSSMVRSKRQNPNRNSVT